MVLEISLDDAHQTSVYIPYQGPGKSRAASDAQDTEAYTLFPDRDLLNGYRLRLAAYKTAWSKCLQRVQELIHALHVPIVNRVAELVNKAYADTLPGLPYPELPVIPVTVFGASSIFDQISARLETEGQDGLFGDSAGTHIVTHIFPHDCPNLPSTIKTLITGFINKTEELESVKRKPASSLSTADIHLLQIWFDAIRESRGPDSDATRLVVILHGFEQFDPVVVQDLFEITSFVVPRLPLVFVLSLTSPPTPSYIHATYPRTTLSRLQIRSCSFSTSQEILHDILLETFFDVEFDPDLIIGPATIEFLLDFFGRHSPSLDGLVSILQLAYMKHVEEPLTVFLTDESLKSKDLTKRDATRFVDCALARVQSSPLVPDHSTGWFASSVDELLAIVRAARVSFQEKAKLMRVSFRLFLVVQRFLASLGHKGEKTLPEMMCAVLRGRLGTSYRHVCNLVQRLQANQLDDLLSNLGDFFDSVPAQVRGTERKVISRISAARSVRTSQNSEPCEVAETVGDWLLEYFRHRLVTLEELPLWDIWCTGSTAFPSELINPSLRASIFSGLLYPKSYGEEPMADNDVDGDDEEMLQTLPDTSILFWRYLEGGKMINVFDWFESFTVVLEAQKRHVRSNESVPVRTPSPKKGKQRQAEEDRTYAEENEEALGQWQTETQARFMRSLHELDYIGLLKHTGRKADHVVRTVFDVAG